jgi:hypothetical protein
VAAAGVAAGAARRGVRSVDGPRRLAETKITSCRGCGADEGGGGTAGAAGVGGRWWRRWWRRRGVRAFRCSPDFSSRVLDPNTFLIGAPLHTHEWLEGRIYVL